jgi:hypothetical protein
VSWVDLFSLDTTSFIRGIYAVRGSEATLTIFEELINPYWKKKV